MPGQAHQFRGRHDRRAVDPVTQPPGMYLDDVRRVTDVRNMWGFTGTYKGRPVSVMAHGMGIPSVSIYCHELISYYEVQRIIRVGA